MSKLRTFTEISDLRTRKALKEVDGDSVKNIGAFTDHDHDGIGTKKISHSNLTELGVETDHTWAVWHSLATAASDFLVASGAGAFVKKTLAETRTLLECVLGPATAVVGNVPTFSATDGKQIQDSGVALSNIPTMAAAGGVAEFIHTAAADKALAKSGYTAASFSASGHNHDTEYPALVNPSVADNFVSFSDIAGAQKDSGSKAADFAVAAKGVTNGDGHDHSGGDGAQIDHGGLAGTDDDDHLRYTVRPQTGVLAGWSHRALLTIDGTVPGLSGAVTNAIAIVAVPAGIKAVCQAAGQDVRFTANDGTTLLTYGIEDWSVAEPVVHVLIPSAAATSTSVYCYGGNAGASDAQSKSGVVDANTIMYLPLGDAASPAVDWTSNANNGTQTGSPTFGATGKAGNGVTFASGKYLTLPGTSFPTGTAARSTACWFKFSSNVNPSSMFSYGAQSSSQGWLHGYYNGTQLTLDGYGSGYAKFNWTWDSDWHHLVITYPAGGGFSTVNMYLDGVAKSLTTSGTPNTGSTFFHVSRIGTLDIPCPGTLDNIVVTNDVLSADEVKFMAKSFPGSSMFTWGAAGAIAFVPAAVTDSNLMAYDGTGGKQTKDSGIPIASVVTEASAAAGADNVVTSAGASKVVKDSGVAIANIPTMAAAGGAGELLYTAAADKAIAKSGIVAANTPQMAAVGGVGEFLYTAAADRAVAKSGKTAASFVENALVTAKGDILVATASGVLDNLAAGTDAYSLVADSSTATGLKWADVSAAGVADHGALTGLGDDDHTIYVKHALATATSDFLVGASGGGTFEKKTLAETRTILCSANIATGTYTGDGTTPRNVTHGLGYGSPKFIAVWAQDNTENAVVWTDADAAGYSRKVAGNYINNGILSLTTGAFRVGDHDAVNKNTTVYTFVAIG